MTNNSAYHRLWEAVVAELINNRSTGRRTANWDRLNYQLTQQTIEHAGLDNWVPDQEESRRLDQANQLLTRIAEAEPGPLRDQFKKQLLDEVLGCCDRGWPVLRRLAETYLAEPGPPGALSVRKPSSNNQQTKRIREKQLESHTQAMKKFGENEDSFRIYIDESWPEKNAKTGIIAGIVWTGKNPDFGLLPQIETHLIRNRNFKKAAEAVHKMLDCDRCFPFIMPIRFEEQQANQHYDELVRIAIMIILGWLLPESDTPATVSVLLERYGKHNEKQDDTMFIRGLLKGFGIHGGQRFQRWSIQSFRWETKEYEYVPYGDLLAYLALEQKKGRQFSEQYKIDFKQLPGYVPLSLARLPQLLALEDLGQADPILDFSVDMAGTHLFEKVSTALKRRIDDSTQFKRLLLSGLEARYQLKSRNLSALRKQLKTVRSLIGELPQDADIRMRLNWVALNLQEANHDGNPPTAEKYLQEYRRLRPSGLQNDRELTTYIDLNLAVHYADQFLFETAQEIAEEMITDPLFEALSLTSQARCHSSLGQYLSMQGQRSQAEKEFITALKLIHQSNLPAGNKAGEWNQTLVYFAINSLDDHHSRTLGRVKVVLGQDLSKAAKRLAKDDSPPSLYHHHLLLRCLFLEANNTECQAARTVYLNQQDKWKTGSQQHPWELIALYRALLLSMEPHFDRKPVQRWFDLAFRCASAEFHGPTLHLIGAMIAIVAAARLNNRDFAERALEILEKVQQQIPAAASIIETLDKFAKNARSDQIIPTLEALPFNYH